MSDEKRRRLYDEVRKQTETLAARRQPPVPFNNIVNLFSLTLVSGNRTRTERQPDFSDALVGDLEKVKEEVRALAPQMSIQPVDHLHVTLFPIYRDKPQKFFMDGTPQERHAVCESVAGIAATYSGLVVHLKGLLLAPDGTLVVCGFDESGDIDRLREKLNKALPDQERPFPQFLHVTLARYQKPMTAEPFQKLQQWVDGNQNRVFSDLLVRHPILIATQDRAGVVLHEECEKELERFYG